MTFPYSKYLSTSSIDKYVLKYKYQVQVPSTSTVLDPNPDAHVITLAGRRSHTNVYKILILTSYLYNDLSNIYFKMECIDVNLVVDSYNTVLSSLLDSHAPLKTDYATSRILQSWMSEEILSVN